MIPNIWPTKSPSPWYGKIPRAAAPPSRFMACRKLRYAGDLGRVSNVRFSWVNVGEYYGKCWFCHGFFQMGYNMLWKENVGYHVMFFSCWLCWKMFNDMFSPMFTMAGAWWYHPKLEGFMAMDSPWWHINHIIGLSINGGTPIAGWFLSWKNL